MTLRLTPSRTGGGTLDVFEAEALAIFESSMGTHVTPSLQRGVDAMIFRNKSVSHFGTGGRALNNKQFDTWMKGAFEKHFADKTIDYYLIDVRKMTSGQKSEIENAVKAKGAAAKTYLIQ